MPTYLYIVKLQLLRILYLQKYSTIVQVLYVPLLCFLNCDKKFELLVQEKIVTANDHICTQHPQLNGPITWRAIASEGIWMANPFSSAALLEEG